MPVLLDGVRPTPTQRRIVQCLLERGPGPPTCPAGAGRARRGEPAVLNELSVLPGDLVLALDDYHRADGPGSGPTWASSSTTCPLRYGWSSAPAPILTFRWPGFAPAASSSGPRRRRRFIARFTGDDRFVVDHLVDEVLDRQPEAVRQFLLETTILERLERANLFLVPLDDQLRW